MDAEDEEEEDEDDDVDGSAMEDTSHIVQQETTIDEAEDETDMEAEANKENNSLTGPSNV